MCQSFPLRPWAKEHRRRPRGYVAAPPSIYMLSCQMNRANPTGDGNKLSFGELLNRGKTRIASNASPQSGRLGP